MRGVGARREVAGGVAGDDEVLVRASAVLKSQGRRKLVPWEARYGKRDGDRSAWEIEIDNEMNRSQVRRCVISLQTILEH